MLGLWCAPWSQHSGIILLPSLQEGGEKEDSRQKQGHSLLQGLPRCSYLPRLLHHLIIVFIWGLSVCMNPWECSRSKLQHVAKFPLKETASRRFGKPRSWPAPDLPSQSRGSRGGAGAYFAPSFSWASLLPRTVSSQALHCSG